MLPSVPKITPADDTNLLCLKNSIKKLYKLVNADLKHLANWLNAERLLELLIFNQEVSIPLPYSNKTSF